MEIETHHGRKITVTVYKNARSKKAAFLFHGLGGYANQWREQKSVLKKEHTLIIPHLFGHDSSQTSLSNKASDYSFTAMAEDMGAVFQHFKLDQNILLGHSYGAGLAIYVALRYQQQINKMILINPIPYTTQQKIPWIYYLPACILKKIQPKLVLEFDKIAFDKTASADLIAIENEKASRNDMFVVRSMAHGMKTIPKDNLSTLKIPILIIWGENDRLIPPARSKVFYRVFPHAEFFTVSDASHMVLLEKPDVVNQAIVNFLISG